MTSTTSLTNDAQQPLPLLVSPQLIKPLLVSIDGNIGSGKSTTWEMLKQAYAGRDDVHFVEEPVGLWDNIKDAQGVDDAGHVRKHVGVGDNQVAGRSLTHRVIPCLR